VPGVCLYAVSVVNVTYCMHGVFLGSVESFRSRSSRKSVGPQCNYCEVNGLVRALSLNVAGLLALVASTLAAGLRGAVSGKMTNFTAVVALLALSAVT
jgi:hypothetical protein